MTPHATDLLWRGRETIETATVALAQRNDVALYLPAELHHAVATCLHISANPGSTHGVNIRGGSQLVSRLSAIRGLEPLTALIPPIERARASVQVLSPSPRLTIRCAVRKVRPIS